MSSADADFESLWDRARLRRTGWFVVGGLSLAGLAWSPRLGASVVSGGLVSMLNAELLFELTERATAGTPRRGIAVTLFALLFRYILLFVGLYVIFIVWRFNILATAIGLSAPVIAVFVEWARTLPREFGSNNK